MLDRELAIGSILLSCDITETEDGYVVKEGMSVNAKNLGQLYSVLTPKDVEMLNFDPYPEVSGAYIISIKPEYVDTFISMDLMYDI